MDTLIQAAQSARKFAKAPYSQYKVGAAFLLENDAVVSGCNVESASYSLTCCAERVAIFKAISDGHHSFKALAVATRDGGSPCGACRQVIWEQCGDIPIYLVDDKNQVEETTSRLLLPRAFDDTSLET